MTFTKQFDVAPHVRLLDSVPATDVSDLNAEHLNIFNTGYNALKSLISDGGDRGVTVSITGWVNPCVAGLPGSIGLNVHVLIKPEPISNDDDLPTVAGSTEGD